MRQMTVNEASNMEPVGFFIGRILTEELCPNLFPLFQHPIVLLIGRTNNALTIENSYME